MEVKQESEVMEVKRFSLGALVATATLMAIAPAAPRVYGDESRSTSQSQTQTVVAGEQYEHAPGGTMMLGADYRDLWTTPIEVEVLSLQTAGGGLSPVTRVGGNETLGLAMKGQDGLSYTFRAVDKNLSGIVPSEFKGTPIELIVSDQIAGNFPGVQVVAGPLSEAAGVLHVDIRLVVMPDDPALGQYRKDFANVLGVFMEYPQPGFQGATEILGHEEFWTLRMTGPPNLADARAFLRARLFDILLGDWDRHRGQWRWVRIPGQPRLQPLPEDRDQIFADFEGKVLDMARSMGAQMVTYEEDYVSLYDATQNGWDLDRFLLTSLDKSEWMEIAADLQGRITDEVIDTALHRLPPEYYALRGSEIEQKFRARRDKITEEAERFYYFMAGQVDVQCSNQSEIVVVERFDGNEVEVSVAVAKDNETPTEPYYHRRFKGDETKEVRIYLHGGNNRVVTRGNKGGGPRIRVIGGAANDVVDDSQGGKVDFYDFQGNNRVVGDGSIHTRPFKMPPRMTGDPVEQEVPWVPTRDWGRTTTPKAVVGYHADPGMVLGGGFTSQSQAFRKYPWANRHVFTAAYAIGANKPVIDYKGDFRRQNHLLHYALHVRWSGIDQLRYYGLGNETSDDLPTSAYQISSNRLTVFPALTVAKGAKGAFLIGPIVHYSDSTGTDPDTVLEQEQPLGVGTFGEVGLRTLVRYDSRTDKDVLAGGIELKAAGSYYPELWDVESAFGSIGGELGVHVPLSDSVTVSSFVGGKKVWGDYPFFEAAYLGGQQHLYGYHWDRFVGDASLYGSAAVRWAFKKVRFALPGELGLMGTIDAGRVFVAGEDSHKWHPSYAAGIFYAPFNRHLLFEVGVGHSTESTFFLVQAKMMGLGF
ncbi:MAG: hypothetical protein E2P02_05040 [Acidobacteria bacterium]|nr:MAG: hypothetical protein E2P02_05040 [Acidobacteriota bacterium]